MQTPAEIERNSLVEWHPFKQRWMPAYSKFRGRQIKLKRLALNTARRVFGSGKPNDLGNYPGFKNKPALRPASEPLSPSERFRRLVIAFQSFTRTETPRKPSRGRSGVMKRSPFHVHRTGVITGITDRQRQAASAQLSPA